MIVPSLCDPEMGAFAVAGMFTRHKAKISGISVCVRKAGKITGLHDQGHSGHGPDPQEALQVLNFFTIRIQRGEFSDPFIQSFDLFCQGGICGQVLIKCFPLERSQFKFP